VVINMKDAMSNRCWLFILLCSSYLNSVVAVSASGAQPIDSMYASNVKDHAASAPILRVATSVMKALATEPSNSTRSATSSTADVEQLGIRVGVEVAWRESVRKAARELLVDGRLSVLLAEPMLAEALVAALHSLPCTEDTAAPDVPANFSRQTSLNLPQPQPVAESGLTPGDSPMGERKQLPRQKLRAVDLPDARAPVRPPALVRSATESCGTDADCQVGKFCGNSAHGPVCLDCSVVSSTHCYDLSGDCCSVTFRTQCPSNPAECKCQADGDCPMGEFCARTLSGTTGCYSCEENSPATCYDISGDCCSASFRAQCPTNPAACCVADVDCPLGEYCSRGSSCVDCSNVSPTVCPDISGDCCSATFRTQCPTNPRQCECEVNYDCPVGETCNWGFCGYPSADGATLMEAFVHDQRTAAAWSVVRGWRNATDDPCGAPVCGMPGAPLCAWDGLRCTGGRVGFLDLTMDPGLGFELGPAIGELSELQALYLYELPLFSGAIPAELSRLASLLQLLLFSNPMLFGTIPPELGVLTKLTNLNLEDNPKLSGTVPPELAKLASLTQLHLGSPMLSGTIPSALGQLNSLAGLSFDNNPRLSGTIPSEVGHATSLTELHFVDIPQLCGTIPSDLGNLPILTYLAVQNADLLSGTIPSQLGQLSTLKTLYISGHPRLSGTIPSALGQLTSLTDLQLGNNPMLSGTIPPQFVQLESLTTWMLRLNPRLSGTIPCALGQLGSLTILSLENNPSLRGTIPPEMGQLTRLKQLDMHYCTALSGTLPPELNGMVELEFLHLSGSTKLSGTLPDLSATRLLVLDAGNCSFSGLPAALPPCIDHLYLNNNPLRSNPNELSVLLGSLPNERLRVLDVGYSNSPIVLEFNGNSYGTRVYNPTQCHIGGRCMFVLHMYDSDDSPVRVGALISNMTLRFNGSSTPMIDARDGTFTAAVPTDWIGQTGQYLFHFFHEGTEFRPSITVDNAPGSVSDCSFEGGLCTSLRTVEFLSRKCPEESHTVPDATGATCNVCEEGFERVIDTNDTIPKCYKSCGIGETVSHDGRSCVCSNHDYYNTSLHGTIICSVGEWVPPRSIAGFTAVQSARSEGAKCAACPTECLRCENGTVTVLVGWRLNSSSEDALRSQILHGKDGRPQYIFSCPYKRSDCPEMELSGALDASSVGCSEHHAGPLCGSCEVGFSRRGSSDNACEECRDVSGYITAKFGLTAGWFAVILTTILASIGAATKVLAGQLRWIKTATKTNLRILIGSAQVLSLIPSVLELVFPTQPTAALSFVAVSVVDLRDILRFECWGWSWYDQWLATVVGLPLIVTLPIAAHWMWRCVSARHIDADSRKAVYADAKQTSVGALFFVVMLIYPQLSASILSSLRCRSLGEEASYLEADYSVDCRSERYSHYQAFAYMLVVVVPFGFPLVLLGVLMHEWRKSYQWWQRLDRSEAMQSPATEDGQVDVDVTPPSVAEFHYKRVHSTFGFCMDDYRAECFWFEPVDLLRKLALSGLLQFVHRGTAAQCFCGSAIAFASFGVQQWLRPYREHESNVLKALVDTQLFVTFLISFILRVLPEINSAEPFGAAFYGWLLLCSMIALAIVAIGLTLAQMQRRQHFRSSLLRNSARLDASSLVLPRPWEATMSGGSVSQQSPTTKWVALSTALVTPCELSERGSFTVGQNVPPPPEAISRSEGLPRRSAATADGELQSELGHQQHLLFGGE
jgi:hypothetical protein